MRAVFLALGTLFIAGLVPALQGESGPVIQVDFTNPGLIPSHWTLVLHRDGSGHFRSERGHASNGAALNPDPPQLVAPDQDRDVRLSAQFAERVFQAAQDRRWFNFECESHLKVAFQGWKELSYSGPEGQGSCKFNYSKDKEIQALGDSLVGVAGTILEGARLEMLLQHDRLGLDQEMDYIMESQGDGRLQQICAIRSILERLAEDQGVMERVRRRARLLLAKPEE